MGPGVIVPLPPISAALEMPPLGFFVKYIPSENRFLLQINLILSQIFSQITFENFKLLSKGKFSNFEACQSCFPKAEHFLAHI